MEGESERCVNRRSIGGKGSPAPQVLTSFSKADLFAVGLRRRRQLSNRVKDDFELTIVLAFEFVQPARELGVRGEYPAETNEGSHDFDVDMNGAWTFQNAREHEDTVFGEGVGAVLDVIAAFQGHKL